MLIGCLLMFIATGKPRRCSLPLQGGQHHATEENPLVLHQLSILHPGRFLVQGYNDPDTDSSRKCQSKPNISHRHSGCFIPCWFIACLFTEKATTAKIQQEYMERINATTYHLSNRNIFGYTLIVHPHIFMLPKSPTLRNSSWKRCPKTLSKRPSVQRRVKLRLLAEDSVAVRARRRKGGVRSGGLAGAELHLKAYKQTNMGISDDLT